MKWSLHRWAAIGVLISTTASGAQSCDTAGGDSGTTGWSATGACRRIDTRGIEHVGSRVTDVITARCGKPYPVSHTLEAWLEYRPDRESPWQFSESRLNSTVPDEEGVNLIVSEPCRPGQWRAGWKTFGVGGPPANRPFRLPPDHDFFPTTVEC